MTKPLFPTVAAALTLAVTHGAAVSPSEAETPRVFEEHGGLLVVEAEHFEAQTQDGQRAWHVTTAEAAPEVAPDGDPPHAEGASGGAYLEILPDTRRSRGDKLVPGENFSNVPGKIGVLHYPVVIHRPGRYYVWARIFSTGTEDNGLHVGLDGAWPASGQRLQWCEGKNTWRWQSKQRTEANHCGEPHLIYLDIDEPGQHVVSFSMREDGVEFDRFMLTDRRLGSPAEAEAAIAAAAAEPQADAE